MAKQGTHFWLLTLQKQSAPGGVINQHTFKGTLTPPSGSTRLDAYELVFQAAVDNRPDMAGAVVLAFDLQPNTV